MIYVIKFFIFTIPLILIFWFSYAFVKEVKPLNSKTQKIISSSILCFYILSILLFGLVWGWNSADFSEAIDHADSGYSPISKWHELTFYTFLILNFFSQYKLWSRARKNPPLTLVLYFSFLIIGIIYSIIMLLQVSLRVDGDNYISQVGGQFMMIAPILSIIISLFLISKVISEEAINAEGRQYRDAFLDNLNTKLKQYPKSPLLGIIVFFPIFLVITCVLIIFGQEIDSSIKMFTETSTWRFSQETHPPYINNGGHYLCTVAACGSPKIVKPVRLGSRHGKEIIVNRQLMIANAFEDIIQQKFPKTHHFIRRNYDKYGYPLSKDITNARMSNLTYILMKPLEWFFLTFIYIFSTKPEKLINHQYRK